MDDKHYGLIYKNFAIEESKEGFSLETIKSRKAKEDIGACDGLLFVSIVRDEDDGSENGMFKGEKNYNIFSRDGFGRETHLRDGEILQIIGVLASDILEREESTLNEHGKAAAQQIFNTIRGMKK